MGVNVSANFKDSFKQDYRRLVARSIMELHKDELDWKAINEVAVDIQILVMEADSYLK